MILERATPGPYSIEGFEELPGRGESVVRHDCVILAPDGESIIADHVTSLNAPLLAKSFEVASALRDLLTFYDEKSTAEDFARLRADFSGPDSEPSWPEIRQRVLENARNALQMPQATNDPSLHELAPVWKKSL